MFGKRTKGPTDASNDDKSKQVRLGGGYNYPSRRSRLDIRGEVKYLDLTGSDLDYKRY